MERPIAVVQGSLNCDIFVRGAALPKLGETVIGCEHALYSGGKGANQAVQLTKLGAEVYMVGRVGRDSYGRFVLKQLQSAGVHTEFVLCEDDATGIGAVQCDADGRYYAMVVPNANGRCRAEDVLAAKAVIEKADVMMCQLETTDEAVYQTAELAKQFSIPLIINPAPAKQMDSALFSAAHTITPNETEAAFYTGIEAEEVATPQGREKAAERLIRMGAARVLLTLGSRGSFYADGRTKSYMDAFPVHAVDTTAAGDAFNAAYAYAVACGMPLQRCLLYANAAGALATTRRGAQSSMCDAASLKKFLEENDCVR